MNIKNFVPTAKMFANKAIKYVADHKAETILSMLLGGMTLDDIRVSRSRKKEREKNKLYQEALKKHQAQINALKSAREREEYKDRLWEALMSQREG